MRELAELRVTQTRIYPIDRIPYQSLLVARHLTALQEQFHFKSMGPPEEAGQPGLAFDVGDFRHEGKDYPFLRLLIQPQRTVMTAAAPSSACNAAHGMLESFLAQIDSYNRFVGTHPSLFTEETVCAVDLDFGLQDLLSKRFVDFVSKDLQSAFCNPAATATISPSRVAMRISYTMTDSDLAESGFRIADKTLVIEPRAHTSPTKHRFFTQSPTDSETHLRLLRALEEALK